jgi:hypothetical protein
LQQEEEKEFCITFSKLTTSRCKSSNIRSLQAVWITSLGDKGGMKSVAKSTAAYFLFPCTLCYPNKVLEYDTLLIFMQNILENICRWYIDKCSAVLTFYTHFFLLLFFFGGGGGLG